MGEIITRPTPPAPMHFTGERLTSDYGGQTQIEHLHRYLLAREWCRGKDVLDVASGEGYGTALLAQVARSAVGVEIAPDAVEHAAASYAAENLSYVEGDARAMPAPDAAFDVVVSFETIEHFAEQAQFLQEVRRVLRPGGLLIVSTPDRDNYSPSETPANPYHVQELTEAEFEALLRSRFAEVAILSQRPVFGSVLLPAGAGAGPVCFERRGAGHFEGSAGLSRPQYLVAFASDSPVGELPPSVYIDTGRLGMVNPPEAEARLQAVQSALEGERRQRLDAAEQEQRRHSAEIDALQRHFEQQRLQTQQRSAQADADLQHARAQAETHAAALRDRAAELEALRIDLAAAQGEVKGLVAANEMAERVCAAMRAELSTATRTAADAQTAHFQVHQSEAALRTSLANEMTAHYQLQQTEQALRAALSETEARLRRTETELTAARDRGTWAQGRIDALVTSVSWRLTAPVRVASRLLLRRP